MSQNTNNNQSSALEIAWQRYAEFDHNAQKTSRQHLRLRDGVIVLGVVATLLATFIGRRRLRPSSAAPRCKRQPYK